MCSLVTLAAAASALRAGPIPALPRPVNLAADGSFLDPQHTVSSANAEAVLTARRAGLQVFLATGRARSGDGGMVMTPVVARSSGLSFLRCGRPVLSAAPAKKVKTPWKTLLSLCKPDAAPLVTAFVCLAVAASGDALLPALQGAALNAALGLGMDAAGSLAQLRPALVRLAAVGFGTAVFTGIRGFCFWVCGARLVARLRATLFDALLAQPQAFHDEQGPGDLSTRLATDCVKLGDVLSLNVNIVLRQVLQSLAGMAVVLRLSGRLALLVVTGVMLRSLFAHFYSMAARRLSQAQQNRLAASSGVAEQCFSLIKLVRSHGSQRSERRRYGQQLDGLLRLQTEYGAIYGCSRVFNGAVNAALNVAVLAGGAALVAAGVLPREALSYPCLPLFLSSLLFLSSRLVSSSPLAPAHPPPPVLPPRGAHLLRPLRCLHLGRVERRARPVGPHPRGARRSDGGLRLPRAARARPLEHHRAAARPAAR